MKNLFIAFTILFTTSLIAQTHQIIKHDGETIDINFIKTANNLVKKHRVGWSLLKPLALLGRFPQKPTNTVPSGILFFAVGDGFAIGK